MIGAAIKVAKIATGEIEEDTKPDDGKDKAAQELGRKGGKARAEALTPEQRREVAKAAAEARWKRSKSPIARCHITPLMIYDHCS